MIDPITPCTCITAHDRMVCVGWCKPKKDEAKSEPQFAKSWLEGDEWGDCLVCPYCGDKTEYVDACERTETLYRDGDRTMCKCDECGKEFKVTLSVSYEFKTDPIPNLEKK